MVSMTLINDMVKYIFKQTGSISIPTTWYIGLSTNMIIDGKITGEVATQTYTRMVVPNNSSNFVITQDDVARTSMSTNIHQFTFNIKPSSTITIKSIFVANSSVSKDAFMWHNLENPISVGAGNRFSIRAKGMKFIISDNIL